VHLFGRCVSNGISDFLLIGQSISSLSENRVFQPATCQQAQLTESPFGGLLKPFIDSIDPKPTFFLTRDAVANATAPACTILHDPPITSRRDEPTHDAEM
jgi:hypothetical protein